MSLPLFEFSYYFCFMKMIQELGLAIAIFFIVIGYVAKKHDYKTFAVFCYILASISFCLFVLGFFIL